MSILRANHPYSLRIMTAVARFWKELLTAARRMLAWFRSFPRSSDDSEQLLGVLAADRFRSSDRLPRL